MIQANELRIGNWIYDDNITLSKVIGFSPFDWSTRCDEEEGCEILLDLYRTPYGIREGMMCESTRCEPIPLTPEILEKCGFENWDKNKYSNDVLCLTVNGDGYLYLANQRHVNIFYLHQLQNIYFALTGEELTFKP